MSTDTISQRAHSKTRLTFFITLMAAGMTLATAGCKSSRHIVNAHKPESLQTIKQLPKAEVRTLLTSALRNTALLTIPRSPQVMEGPDVRVLRPESATASIQLPFQMQHWCAAVPITDDGYYLTAAHYVENVNRLKMVSLGEDGQLIISNVHVVWCAENREPDLAILHSSSPSWTHLELNYPTGTARDSIVLTGGWSSMDSNPLQNPERSVSAGTLLSVSAAIGTESTPTPRYRILTHNAPCGPGDSGGPLIDQAGTLLGIHSHGSFGKTFAWQRVKSMFGDKTPPVTGYHVVAYSPDPEWIQQVIEEDRSASGN